MVGNAVPPLLARALGLEIRRVLSRNKETLESGNRKPPDTWKREVESRPGRGREAWMAWKQARDEEESEGTETDL